MTNAFAVSLYAISLLFLRGKERLGWDRLSNWLAEVLAGEQHAVPLAAAVKQNCVAELFSDLVQPPMGTILPLVRP